MLRTALFASAFCAVAAQLSDVERSNIDVIEPPGFQLTNLTFSLYMNCVDTTTCFTGTASKPGLYNKQPFLDAFLTAYNTVSKRVRKTYADAATTDTDSLAFEITSSNVVFERVISQTSPFTPDVVTVNLTDDSTITDPGYWNIFLRVSLVDVPADVSEQFRAVIFELTNTYTAASIHFDSIWVSSEAYFITDQLEPVRGRGHKDQKLLIPLIMGVFCMLVVPILVSACAVWSAKSTNKNLALVAEKEKLIKEINDNLVSKQSAINTYHETEEAREEETAKNLEKRRLRDDRELTAKDVDWSSKQTNPVSAPFGSEHDE